MGPLITVGVMAVGLVIVLFIVISMLASLYRKVGPNQALIV